MIDITKFKQELKDLLEKYSVEISFECYDTQGISGETMALRDKHGNHVAELTNTMEIAASDLIDDSKKCRLCGSVRDIDSYGTCFECNEGLLTL